MKNFVQMQQVHGNNVILVGDADAGKTIPNCDGLITSNPNIKLVVRTADCLPISIIDKKGRIHGIIHAGWRGLENGVIGKALNKINDEFGITNYDLQIKIGPHICRKHYEIKEDVFTKFTNFLPFKGVSFKGGRMFLDLGKIAETQLIDCGVKKENIDIDKRCTFEETTLPSYRRNKTNERLYTIRGRNEASLEIKYPNLPVWRGFEYTSFLEGPLLPSTSQTFYLPLRRFRY